MSIHYSSSPYAVNSPHHELPEYQVSILNGYSEFKSPPLVNIPENQGRGKRSKITQFSPRARKNMLKAIFGLSQYPSIFITLTYPRFYPADSQEWKRHLDNFFRDVRRKFPQAWFFWKLEPQKRGAPHFHLIGDLGSEIKIHIFRNYLAQLWFRIVDSKDTKHLNAGTQADYISDSIGKMRAYVCKYVGKADAECSFPEWSEPGRFWGRHGHENMPPVLITVANISEVEFTWIKRLVRRWLKHLSHSSKKYANRLKSIPTFFLLSESATIKRIVEFVLGYSLGPPLPIEVVYPQGLEVPF